MLLAFASGGEGLGTRGQFTTDAHRLHVRFAAAPQQLIDLIFLPRTIQTCLHFSFSREPTICFQYEYRNAKGQWFRAYGNELWEFDDWGLMRRREASINDVTIAEEQHKFHWSAPSPRPGNNAGIPNVA